MNPSSGVLSWVVGSGGLLGSSVVSSLSGRSEVWRPDVPVRWGRPDTGDQLAGQARSFVAAAASSDRPWQVIWCAGAGVTSTSPDALEVEQVAFDEALGGLAAAGSAHLGAFFLASSAGGLYAGSRGAPYDEMSEPVPLAPYGATKLALERRAALFHDVSGVPVLVGRISNLYGPGQNLGKAQGLISQIVRSHLLGQPISIYVPLDTVRDNLYVTDCAGLIIDGLDRLRTESVSHGPCHRTKVLASQQGVTIGFLIAELGRIFKRRPRVVYGASAYGSYQARDLRMRSRVWTDLDRRPLTPLPVGMRKTIDALGSSLAQGTLR